MNVEIINSLFGIAKTTTPVSNSRIAAAIVLRNKIVCTATNVAKSHPFQKKFGKNENAVFFHAETHAIKRALDIIPEKDLKRCDLYVVRAKQDDNKKFHFGLACPCAGCAYAIGRFGIRNVFYSTNEGDIRLLT